MSREEVFEKLNVVFRDVFDDETITVNDETTALDIEGWDSLNHVTLIQCIEEEFSVKFSMKDIASLQNVGKIVDLLVKVKA